MRHFATHHPDIGPVVAQHHSALGAVVVCEFLTIESAQREADRMNREAQAMAAMAVRRYRPDCGWMHPRRSVRYFENEDIDR